MQSTDSRMIRRVKSLKDTEAWNVLYRLYSPVIFSFARSMRMNWNDADEVRSIVLVKLVEFMPRFEYVRARGGFRRWLCAVTRNAIRDMKFGRKRPIAVGNDVIDTHRSRDMAPEDKWELAWNKAILEECVRMALSQVREFDSQVYQLRMSDRSNKWIAAKLEVPPAKVHSAFYDVRKKIKELEVQVSNDPGNLEVQMCDL